MKNLPISLVVTLFIVMGLQAQSPSFQTYVNPVIPGDHPDPTLTKIGDFFYTSGSSFNPTPKIYRSSDLVHWEVISQPVSPTWAGYGNNPGGGIWGGHTVLYNGKYWHYFGRGGGSMYFVTADQPEGPWSGPTTVSVPNGISSLGVDNSIFIDDDTGKWYMLAKHGRQNNHIVELGENGQPNGNILDFTWLNPDAEDNPYGWAEGPVMWKYNGTYYYSFAQHLAGYQYVMKSDTLSDDPEDWTIKSQPQQMQYGSAASFRTPNHISPAVLLDDSTSWVIGHSYHSDWVTQGRQGLLLQITYDEDGFPEFEYPQNEATPAPDLSSNGIPWMVPKSDMFNEPDLSPVWSFLGNAFGRAHSLTDRPGWLHLESSSFGDHTLIQNDGEHQYSLITRVDFSPESISQQAGLRVINGPEDLEVKLYSSVNEDTVPVFVFSFDENSYETDNKIGSIVWLKLTRNQHEFTAHYSDDGNSWRRVGGSINASELNVEQSDFNDFTGNQQGIFVQGSDAFFDLYIYRDAYSYISASEPANFSGVTRGEEYLEDIHNGDWALYAGVEFGTEIQPEGGFDYQRTPGEFKVEASSANNGGTVEVWIDSINTGTKISEFSVPNTGNWDTFIEFSTETDSINGRHDVYLKFTGTEGDELFRLKQFRFTPRRVPLATSIDDSGTGEANPFEYTLSNNYPNPFNPTTNISFSIPDASIVTLKVYDITGRELFALIENSLMPGGNHSVAFDGKNLASGVYIYRLQAGNFVQSKKMTLLK